jgi:CRP-like cAMP-binding protein
METIMPVSRETNAIFHVPMPRGSVREPASNRLLAALPTEEYDRIAAELSDRPIKLREVLHEDGELLRQILFPGRSVCSILLTMEDGSSIEIGMVGSEGLIGLAAAFGGLCAWGSAVVQIEGDRAQMLSVEAFHREMAKRGVFYETISGYSKAFSRMVMIKSACHGLHSAEARCCSWLLGSIDRLGRSEFPVTHDALATSLGVRRPTVTLALLHLARAGIVTQFRGRVRVLDRDKLEASACECYQSLRVLFHPAARA